MSELTVSESSQQNMMEEEIDLREYWAIITGHKWSIFGLAFVFALVAALVVFSMKPIYKSTATLLIESQSANVVSIEEIYGLDGGNKEYYETQFGILRSRALAVRVIAELNLLNHAEYQPKEDGFSLHWKSWLPADFFQKWMPAKDVTDAMEAEQRFEKLLKTFQGNLNITPIIKSHLVSISYMAKDRQLAALVVNTMGDQYIKGDLEARLKMTSKATEWLTERLGGLRQTLSDSEKSLQNYRDQEQLVEVEGVGTITASHLEGLSGSLVAAEQKQAVAQSSYAEVQKLQGQPIESFFSVPAVLADSLASSLKSEVILAKRAVITLKKRYGPMHPTLIHARADYDEAKANFSARVESVTAGIRKDYQAASVQTRATQRSIDTVKAKMQDINRKGYQLGVLEREVESNRQLYELFLARFKETNETSGLQRVNARVSDPAVAAISPIKPKKKFIIAIAGIMGLFLGVMLAFLREHLNNTIKTTNDLEDKLNLPVLGMLPQLEFKNKKIKTPLTFMMNEPKSFFSESIRTIRTSLMLSSLDDPHKIVIVTSTLPGEGKSTVSMILAHSLAEMGKVLLIDADMRRPTIAKNVGLDKKDTGLSEFVADTASLKDCIHKLEGTEVYVMPSGAVPPNPLELLSSQHFVQALDKLDRTFTNIIIDSAPALAVSDALVLSTHASGVVYVIKADATPHPMAQEGIKRLTRAGAHLIGGVLNNVVAKNGSKSEYGKYSGNYYGSYGYTSDE